MTVGTTDLKRGDSVTMEDFGANVSRDFGRRRRILERHLPLPDGRRQSGYWVASWSGEHVRVLYIEG